MTFCFCNLFHSFQSILTFTSIIVFPDHKLRTLALLLIWFSFAHSRGFFLKYIYVERIPHMCCFYFSPYSSLQTNPRQRKLCLVLANGFCYQVSLLEALIQGIDTLVFLWRLWSDCILFPTQLLWMSTQFKGWVISISQFFCFNSALSSVNIRSASNDL